MNALKLNGPGKRQSGVASLVIVAVLFFIMSMVAAYANRNLIFEQRTSANQYRSTQAFEAAQAGLEWAIAMLNAGSIDANCQPSDDPTDTTFRERYLSIHPTTGLITAAGEPPDGKGTVWPSCAWNGTAWTCSCPVNGAADFDDETGPAFRVRLSRASNSHPGLVQVESNGCTRLDDECLDFPARSLGNEGRAMVTGLVALRTALPALPVATITARGAFDLGGAALAVRNEDTANGGVTIISGGTIGSVGDLQLGTVPGSPAALSIRENDAGLIALGDGERLFTSSFALTPTTFAVQPGLIALGDCGGTCNTAALREAAGLNRGRILFVEGDVELDDDGVGDPIGTPDSPVMLVITGGLSFSSAVTIHGLVYTRSADWVTAGEGDITGAVVAEGAVSGSGTGTWAFDRDILTRIQRRIGSFVLVPGGWADFKEPL